METVETVFTLRLKGDVANLVNELMDKGYSESKTELIRTSLVFYGMKLGLFSPKRSHKNVLRSIKRSGKRYTDEQVGQQIASLEQ